MEKVVSLQSVEEVCPKTKEEALELLIKETKEVLARKKLVIKYSARSKDYRVFGGEKTIRRFISSRLVEEDGQIFFRGEHFYQPENWRVNTFNERKKVVNFITYMNMTA